MKTIMSILPPQTRVFAGVMTAFLACVLNLAAADSLREHLSLDANWKFHLGDFGGGWFNRSKAGINSGPAAQEFNDASWRSLDLPHDWAIELPFDKSAARNGGYKPVGRDFPNNSVGWYRRTFILPAEDAGRRIGLQFDGAMHDATVWVNGWLVKRHEGGYEQFREDITDLVNYGGKNTVAVRVDASNGEGWFYEGAGLYRHVWLDKTSPVAIAPEGIFVYSQFPNNTPADEVKVVVEATLQNATTASAKATIRHEIISPAGNPVAKMEHALEVPAISQSEAKTSVIFNSPVLWSPESPKLYKLVTTVLRDGLVVDRQETEFGIRTLAFDKDQGFMLNGKHYELYGTCNHQDHAGVGAAMPDALQYFRVAKLKEFGCNAYRTSHNPPTVELLDACDHLGMMVMDECRLLGSDEGNLLKWEHQIRRDRNHASVVLWSICNEEPLQDSMVAGRVGATMQALVKKLDPTRSVTAAANTGNVYSGLMEAVEVRGWNYSFGGGNTDRYHASHPNQPNVGTEEASYVSTRGVYEHDKERGYVSSYGPYDTNFNPVKDHWWPHYADRPWLSGGFVWTGFDYRGEPTPYNWPCINSAFGILDTCGFPKDDFYYYQSWWTKKPVLHLLPHWNWAGKEGREIRVEALSNCEEVELFLNHQSLGKQVMPRNGRLSWQVKYAAGTLRAKGYHGGKVAAETEVETTGTPADVQLHPDRSRLSADGGDVSMITVSVTDAQGRVVPTAGNKIHFTIAGNGRILGVGNGDPSCHEPDTFVALPTVKSIPARDWRWNLAKVPDGGEAAPEFAPDFNDSDWNPLPVQTKGAQEEPRLKRSQTAIFRTHVSLAEADLVAAVVQISFGGLNDEFNFHSRMYVNGQCVGESNLKSAGQPAFDGRRSLHAGDNVIVVAARMNRDNPVLKPRANVECISDPAPVAWARSTFNGLAQIIVQSTREPGEIRLTATSEGLKPATALLSTEAGPVRPQVP
ncbi:MAG: beta-galactosidase GalA [Verrucomicrobiota bacterium]